MATIRRILIPTDLGAASGDALEFARGMAESLGAALHLLHVVAPHVLPPMPGTDPDRDLREARRQLDRALRTEALDGLSLAHDVRRGRPWAEIVAYAREQAIDLIVMATHGRTGLTHLVMGSVAEQVIRHAPCPVLVVRPSPGAVAALGDLERRAGALRSLRDHFGPALAGDRPGTRQRMSDWLVRALGLAPAEADRMLADLEASRALLWSDPPEPGESAVEAGAAAPAPGWTIAEAEPLPGPARDVGGSAEAPLPVSIDLIARALAVRATDLHIGPTADDRFEVRFRIDGALEHYCDLDRSVAAPLLQQLKVLAGLDIAEPFQPKEGRLQLPEALEGVEVRITTAPVQGGEAVALRLLRRDRVLRPRGDLGLSEAAAEAVAQMLRIGDGLVLVTGPTGAGKTTTLYSLLHQLGGPGHPRHIVSIEDPVEISLGFVHQVGVDPRHNLTMTQGLRTILRMDPDVVFVGEIRDVEAAEIAMRAASSGRFVLSTLHTRDVASTITALRDLHIDNRSLAGNLTGLISQRLVRRLCPHCASRAPLTDEEARAFLAEGLDPPSELGRPVGCAVCRRTGYLDRIGVFEAVVAPGAVAEAIGAGAPEDELRARLRAAGTPSLMADALAKVRAGITSLDEARGMKWV